MPLAVCGDPLFFFEVGDGFCWIVLGEDHSGFVTGFEQANFLRQENSLEERHGGTDVLNAAPQEGVVIGKGVEGVVRMQALQELGHTVDFAHDQIDEGLRQGRVVGLQGEALAHAAEEFGGSGLAFFVGDVGRVGAEEQLQGAGVVVGSEAGQVEQGGSAGGAHDGVA